MILKVAKLGVKTLRVRSREVDAHAVARGDYEAFLADLEDTMREYDGTGIGLTIVRKAIERMGAQLGFESELGKGSNFWIQLKKG